jgi:Leucine-rich repeat (LRR) protein
MLYQIPTECWYNCLLHLPDGEMWEMFCKLSQVSKSLYSISRTIKKDDRFKLFHQWRKYIRMHGGKMGSGYSIGEIIIRTSPIFDITISPNGEPICHSDATIQQLEEIFNMVSQRVSSVDLSSVRLHVRLNLGYVRLFCLPSGTSFLQSLSGMTQLTSLNLSGNLLYRNIETLANCISNFTKLQLLNLGNNEIDIEKLGMSLLVPSIAKLTQLTALNLEANRIKTRGIELLASVRLPKLTILNLSRNPLDKCATTLCMWLDTMPGITNLDLSSTDIYFSKIPSFFENMKNLQSLTLSNNKIGKSEALMLFRSIKELPNIKEINLSNNNIGIKGITEIVDYLPIMPQLKLDLCNNYIDRATRIKLSKKYYGLTI